jgi:glutamate dehydrogenase
VNIKILLDKVVANGDMTTKQRNALLADMTDDVAGPVLQDNYAQTLAISVVVSEAPRRLYEQARFIDLQEQRGAFDRKLEGLPDKKGLTERQAMGLGLTKPEVAVLLAYSKMAYYEAIIDSDVPDDPFVADRLVAYFPPVLGRRFAGEIANHRLRREIIATTITSSIADHVGPGIGFRVREEVGADIASVARAYLVVSKVFETDQLWRRIEELDNRVPAAVQTTMFASISGFLERTLTTLLRNYKDALYMRELSDRFHDGVAELSAALPKPLASREKTDYNRGVKRLVGSGVPRDLAQSIAGLSPMSAALDIVDVAKSTDTPIETTAWIYSALGHALDLDWIRAHIDELAVQTHWHLLARTKLQAALDGHRRRLTAKVLCASNAGNRKAGGSSRTGNARITICSRATNRSSPNSRPATSSTSPSCHWWSPVSGNCCRSASGPRRLTTSLQATSGSPSRTGTRRTGAGSRARIVPAPSTRRRVPRA